MQRFQREWGVEAQVVARGGLQAPAEPASARQVWLLQRKDERVGERLAKTTGWIRRTLLARRNVAMLAGVEYEAIDDRGLHIRVRGEPRTLEVDTIVVCVWQEPLAGLHADLRRGGVHAHLIGGARVAAELDAVRAIEEGTRVAMSL